MDVNCDDQNLFQTFYARILQFRKVQQGRFLSTAYKRHFNLIHFFNMFDFFLVQSWNNKSKLRRRLSEAVMCLKY